MSVDPKAYYDKFSVTYNRRRGRGYHALIDEIQAAAVPISPSSRILEAGCGTGLVMSVLRSRGATDLVGIDLSSGMLSAARRDGERVAQASVTALPFADASFDVAYSFKVLAHVPDIRLALREMARVVRPGGTLVVEFYNRGSMRGLRWKLKKLLGGESTGTQQRETELFTRYDSLADMISYLPAGTRLETVKGAIVVTPAAAAMRIPLLSSLLTFLERRSATSALARYAGFVMLVVRRL
jgi:ubiquinone/menaquinone biosynthesis C-methylase UbiE